MTSNPSADVLLVGGLALGLAGAILTMFTKSVRLQRRIYWGSWLLASPLMSLSLADRGWTAVAGGMAACLGVSLLYAYLRTSYIKIDGRIYTYTLFRNRPDDASNVSHSVVTEVPQDAYGNVLTAPKFWWTLVAVVLAAASVAVAYGPTPVTIAGAMFVTAVAASTGYIDGHDAFPLARRQRIQLAVVTVAAVPLLLLPPVCYALAYSVGRRQP